MAPDWPQTWSLVELSDAMDAIIDYRGKSPRKTTEGVPLITAKVVKNGRINKPTEFIDEGEYDAWMRRGLPMAGDVLLTTEAPLGEVAQLRDPRVALAQRIIALRGRAGYLDNQFLKYAMLSQFVQQQLRSRSSGTTVLGIRQSELRKVLLPIPPLPEQEEIGAALGSIDDKIDLNQRMNQVLESIARATYKSWFVDFEPVKAKMAGARAFPGMPKETFDQLPSMMTDSSLGAVPLGWEVVPLSALIELIGGGTPKRGEPQYWNGGVPWFSVRDAPPEHDVWVVDTEEKITESGVDNSSAKIMRAGTTIISARGTVGRLALAAMPLAINQSCYGIQGKGGAGDLFVYFSLRQAVAELQQRTHGSVFDTITRRTFDLLAHVKPQAQVLKAFEDLVSPYVHLIRSHCFQARTLDSIRDALLPKLTSGALRVGGSEEVPYGR